MDVNKLLRAKMDRRRLLGNLGLMGVGATLTACSSVLAGPGKETDYDAAILNFALNLEYLEAAFYLAAVGRIAELPGGGAQVQLPSGFDGNTAIDFGSKAAQAYAEEIAEDELAHVNFLRAALDGAGAPVAARPAINLDSSFKTAAAAAFGVYDGPDPGFTPEQFDPFANEVFFLHGAFIFEDVGVSAYKGVARYVTNPDYLEAAAGILAVEAYHAGEIRSLLYSADGRAEGGAVADGRYGAVPIWNIVQAISDARDALDGPSDDDQGITSNGATNIVLADKNGVAYSRTPRNVTNIVYLSSATEAQAVGFFPQGIAVPAGLENDFSFLLSL